MRLVAPCRLVERHPDAANVIIFLLLLSGLKTLEANKQTFHPSNLSPFQHLMLCQGSHTCP